LSWQDGVIIITSFGFRSNNKDNTMRLVLIFIYLILVLLGISFAVLNANTVQLNLYVTTLSLPMSVLIILVLGIGILSGFFIFLGRYWRLKRNLKKANYQLKLTEKEIQNLRSIPLKNQH
jgi:lipopolysaccharide assembly protein A